MLSVKLGHHARTYYYEPMKRELHEFCGVSHEKREQTTSERMAYFGEGKREPSGYYYGQGADALGIKDEKIFPHDKCLKNLLNGKTPDGEGVLRRGVGTVREYKDPKTGEVKRHRSVSHFDLTFSAPKDVSILWATAPTQDVRDQFVRYHRAATQEAMKFVESQCYTRTGLGGTKREDVRVVFAVFEHSTSRKNDPQLHSHCVLINAGLRADKKWGALDSKLFLSRDATLRYTAGQIYQNSLREQLERTFHVKTYDRPFSDGKGVSFGIEGISREVRDTFSKRHTDIESEISSDMTPGQVQEKVLETRPRKEEKSAETLFPAWKAEARAAGLNYFEVVRESAGTKEKAKEIETTDRPTAYRKMATHLQAHPQRNGYTKGDMIRVSLAVSGKDVESARRIATEFQTNYTRETRNGGYKLNRSGHGLVDRDSLRTKAVTYAQAFWEWHKGMTRRGTAAKMTMLYATGKITRKQYLLCKEHQRMARLRFENKISRDEYEQFLERARREKGIASRSFLVRTQQALGHITKRQADYWSPKVDALRKKHAQRTHWTPCGRDHDQEHER